MSYAAWLSDPIPMEEMKNNCYVFDGPKNEEILWKTNESKCENKTIKQAIKEHAETLQKNINVVKLYPDYFN